MCGTNFAWANALFSATPGVPVRMPAVKQVRDNVFREPCTIERFHVGVPSNLYAVCVHKGGGSCESVRRRLRRRSFSR